MSTAPLPQHRHLRVYIALAVACTTPLMLWLSWDTERAFGALGMAAIPLMMWIPGIVALGVRLSAGGLRFAFTAPGHVTWGLPSPVYVGLALAVPAAAASVAHAGPWAAGLLHWLPKSAEYIVAQADGAPLPLALLRWSVSRAPGQLIGAFGEEVGWRLTMVPWVVLLGWKRPWLSTALIWGVWHWPLILTGFYAAGPSPALSALMFLGLTLGLGTFLSWLALASRSVWPAAIGHYAHNAFYQDVWGPFLDGDAYWLWSGEQGVFSLAAWAGVVVVLHRTGALSRALEDVTGGRADGAAGTHNPGSPP